MPAIMIQGTASGAGKSTLVAALCRILRQDGLRPAPFKSQNMSNNAAVCPGGGEIGRSTALQARACGIEPTVDMNPVLLKPTTDTGAQVVLMGKPVRTMSAREYQDYKPSLLDLVRGCLDRLARDHDVIVIEGAGSPAEPNLRDGDIVNMPVAEIANAPVLLAGNIDVGGVFAQFVGTLQILAPAESARVRGFLVNKFRGDPGLLKPGLDWLERETSRPVLGVVPFLRPLRLPEEDGLRDGSTGRVAEEGKVRVDVVLHPRMANFTDFDALEAEPDVSLRYVEAPDGTIPDALILPGTKSTLADLRRLKEAGFGDHVRRCVAAGATVAGICGGFQMLGRRIADPDHVESPHDAEDGLGLLPTETVFRGGKVTRRVRGVHLASGAEIEGYEIHSGVTPAAGRPLLRIASRDGAPVEEFDGADGGRVWGTHVHGLFDAPAFRRHFVNGLRASRGWAPRGGAATVDVDAELDRLAAAVRASVDLDRIYRLLRGTA